MTTNEERIAKIEQAFSDHSKLADKNFEKNSLEHSLILERLDNLERSLLVYRRVVYTVGTTLGAIVGAIINYWDFIVHRVGH